MKSIKLYFVACSVLLAACAIPQDPGMLKQQDKMQAAAEAAARVTPAPGSISAQQKDEMRAVLAKFDAVNEVAKADASFNDFRSRVTTATSGFASYSIKYNKPADIAYLTRLSSIISLWDAIINVWGMKTSGLKGNLCPNAADVRAQYNEAFKDKIGNEVFAQVTDANKCIALDDNSTLNKLYDITRERYLSSKDVITKSVLAN